MKQIIIHALTLSILLTSSAFQNQSSKLSSSKTHLSFFSHTDVEDISANNYKAISTLDPQNGEVVFSVPMQSFEFKKALMQKHFNGPKFLDTKVFPKAKFVGTISNNASINYAKEGSYLAQIAGEMTIKGQTRPIKETATVTIAQHVITVKSNFSILLSDYGIAFEKGKPSSNIAKKVNIEVNVEYNQLSK